MGAIFERDYYLGAEFFIVGVGVVVTLGPPGQFFSMGLVPEGAIVLGRWAVSEV